MLGRRIVIGFNIILFLITLIHSSAYAKREEKEETPKDYKLMAHIQFGVDYGFSCPGLVENANNIAIDILNSEDRLDDFGIGFNFGLDILYNISGPLWLGGGLTIDTTKTHKNFKYYDAVNNFYNEYYGISLTVGSVDGIAMFRFNPQGKFSPYFFGGGGISLTVMNFDNYLVNVYAGEHFYWGQASQYSPHLRAGLGFDLPFFNLGKLFSQVSYSYSKGVFEVMGWNVKRDVWALAFGLDRAF